METTNGKQKTSYVVAGFLLPVLCYASVTHAQFQTVAVQTDETKEVLKPKLSMKERLSPSLGVVRQQGTLVDDPYVQFTTPGYNQPYQDATGNHSSLSKTQASMFSKPDTRSLNLGAAMKKLGLTTRLTKTQKRDASLKETGIGLSYLNKKWTTVLELSKSELEANNKHRTPIRATKRYRILLGQAYSVTPSIRVLGGLSYSLTHAATPESKKSASDTDSMDLQANPSVYVGTSVRF